jgi:hypothetical protein
MKGSRGDDMQFDHGTFCKVEAETLSNDQRSCLTSSYSIFNEINNVGHLKEDQIRECRKFAKSLNPDVRRK